MPFRTLSTRVAVPAGLFALFSVALLSFLLIRALRGQALDEVVHGSESIAEAILLSVDRDMRLNRRDGVRRMVEAVGEHQGIESVRVFNKDGRISYASDPADVGHVVDKGSEACVKCHRNGDEPDRDLDPGDRSRIYTNGGGERLLGTIHVIRNEAGCQGSGCHVPPEEQSVLGVLDVSMSLEPAEARLAAATSDAILISLLAVGFITGGLFLFVRHSVQRPIDRMVSATRRVAGGDPSLPVPSGSAREIGILAGSVNEMIESLASSRDRLEEWAESLEERVSEKADELRDARFQIVQAEKLSSVGQVAAGIAHELNSPLMAIVTFAHMVKSKVAGDEQAQEDLRMIEREANRCAGIIRQLLDYSRKQMQDPELEPCTIADALEGTRKLLKVEIQNSGVELVTSVPDDLPPVEASPPQLMQVFLNLVLNAIQAMEEGGRIEIEADVVKRARYASADLPPHPSGRLVRVRVRDTGPGIPPEARSRVFDPFFTTKPVGKGSGLGLSVSLGLVRGYRGTILVDSDGESWTEFTVLIPAADVAPADGPEADDATNDARTAATRTAATRSADVRPAIDDRETDHAGAGADADGSTASPES